MNVNIRFNVSASLLFVCRVDSNTMGFIEGMIVKVSTRAKVNNSEEILSRALLDKIGDTDDITNVTITDKIVATGGPKGEVGIWPVLIIIIIYEKSIKNAWSVQGVVITTNKLIANNRIWIICISPMLDGWV